MSINTRCVPSAWQTPTAVITPVPKSLPVSSSSNYRPIFVTPTLSSVVEILVVKDFIGLPIPADVLCDQLGFKPTGSTTVSLTDVTHIVSIMLEDNRYVW